jgi:hypothetical protein
LLGDRGHQAGLERLARHGSRLHHDPSVLVQTTELARDRGDHALRYDPFFGRPFLVHRDGSRTPDSASRKLLEVERVPATFQVHRLPSVGAKLRVEQGKGLVGGQRRKLEAAAEPGPCSGL